MYHLGIFFVGVCWFAECNLGPPPLGDYLPSSTVLYRLLVELYSLSFPMISTWGVIRQSMLTNETNWPVVLFEELPEGLSSLGRENEEMSAETTTSVRAPSRPPRVYKRWAVYSYFSRFNTKSLKRIRSRYQIPGDIILRIPNQDEWVCSHVENIAFYESMMTAGLRFPIQPFIRELLDFLSLAPG